MSIKVAEGIAIALDPTIEMARVAIPVSDSLPTLSDSEFTSSCQIIVKTQAQYVMNKALGLKTVDDVEIEDDEDFLAKHRSSVV